MPEHAKTKASVGAAPIDKEMLHQEIQQRAYFRYRDTGCLPGRDFDNWLAAEQELLAEYASRQAAAPSGLVNDTPRGRGSRGRRKR